MHTAKPADRVRSYKDWTMVLQGRYLEAREKQLSIYNRRFEEVSTFEWPSEFLDLL